MLVWAAGLSISDVTRRRLPNAATLPGAAAIVVVAAACGYLLPALTGALALGGIYLAVHVAAPAAMGGGDVKLALGLGALTGAFGVEIWVLAALGAPLLTAIFGVFCLAGRRSATVPHGPSMCAASLAAVALAVF